MKKKLQRIGNLFAASSIKDTNRETTSSEKIQICTKSTNMHENSVGF